MYYNGSRSSYGKSLTYNYSSDLTLSSLSSRNPSIQRVINSEYGSRDRSLSPARDYSPSRLSSPTFRRRDFTDTERSSPVSFLNDIDYSMKSRNYYDYSSVPSTMFSSYSSPIKKPKRTDYSDYLRPVLTTRPMLKSGYSPRSRKERESIRTPLVRERKLIKFREVSDEVLDKIRRKISWDLPEEISSPLIDEMKKKYEEPTDDSPASGQNSSRRSSKDSTTSPISESPRHSMSRRCSGDQTHDRPIRPPLRKNSRSNSLLNSSSENLPDNFQLKQDHSKIPVPPPRKKSLSSSTKGKKSRKSSVDILLSEEKTQNYSKIAEDIRRNREIAERIRKLAEESVDESNQTPQQEETESLTEIKSSSVSKEIVVPDRSRRRRRVSIPEPDIIEEPAPEIRKRVRSRYKSRESSQSISPSAELQSNNMYEDKTPRTTRMHRKSVKYKSDGLPPRRSSKCTDAFLDSVTPSLQEVTVTEESKSNINLSEAKRDSSIKSEEKYKKQISKLLPSQQETADTNIKYKENQMKVNESTAKEKLENKISQTATKENKKYVEKGEEKPKNDKVGEQISDRSCKNKVKSSDQNTNYLISSENATKSKINENEFKEVKNYSTVKQIKETEKNQENAKSLNKVIKEELNISSGKEYSDSKISSAVNKDIKMQLDENFHKTSKMSSENVCNRLPRKEPVEVSLEKKENAKNNKTIETNNLRTKEITKREEKKLDSKTLKYEKQEEKLNSNILLKDVKGATSKECLNKNASSVIQKGNTEEDIDTKIKTSVLPSNEYEEVVIVCKLPKKNEFELKKNIPNEQKVVVSIKNSELKAIECKKGSSDTAIDKIIPTGVDQNARIQNCDIQKNVDNRRTEASDVNVSHTIVLKPKASEVSITNKSKTGKDVHLKSIPDVIKSTVNIGSKEKEMSDVVKSTVKTGDQIETQNLALSEKNKLSDKSCCKIGNDIKKHEKLEPLSDNVLKDKTQIREAIHEDKKNISKISGTNKALLDVKKSNSAIFHTTAETLGSPNIKKSNSEVLEESKTIEKCLEKPDLIEMVANSVKKSEESFNLDKFSRNELGEKSIFNNVDKNRTEHIKNKTITENNQNKITSNIPNELKFQSDNSKMQLHSEIEERKNEKSDSIQKSKTESSIAKNIPKDETSVQKKSVFENVKSDVKVSTPKTSKIKADVPEISPSKNTEISKFQNDLTKKIEKKTVVLRTPDAKDLKENASSPKNSEMKSTAFSDYKNVKRTTPAYTKSATLPNINAVLEKCNNTSQIADSSIVKKDNIELSSLFTSDVPTALQKKSFEHQKPVTNLKTDTVKSINSNQENSSKVDKKSVNTQLPKINSSDISKDSVEKLKKSKVAESDKKSDSEKLINESKETKFFNQSEQNNVLPKINVENSKTKNSDRVLKLNGTKDLALLKIESSTEKENKSVEKDKEIVLNKYETGKKSTTDSNNIQRNELDKKILPPEVLKLPAVKNTSSQSSDSKLKEYASSQNQNKKMDEIIKPDVTNLMKKESQVSNNVGDESCTNNTSALKSEELDLNSNIIEKSVKDDLNSKLEKLSETSNKENIDKITKKSVTDQLEESKTVKNSVPPMPNKIKQPKVPQYQRYGLIVKPKQPPKTIIESSSSEEETTESETETESSSEEETPVIKTNLTNGRYPERSSSDSSPRERSYSENSNTSVSSATSISTTCTTVQEPWDGSPQRLRFRKYSLDDFEFLKLLGKGSFGRVLLAQLRDTNMYFAIKCLRKDVVMEDDDVESTMIERRVLALGTQHPYMCKLYCTFQTKPYLFFVMEYLNGGDLMFHIQENGAFDEPRAVFYASEIVSVLKFLHKRGIIYRDIKLDNLMLDQQGHIRLVDFGMCQCRIYKEECMPSNFCGTPTYIAPEILLGQKYNQSVDWWSFGVLLYEMLIGRSPFHGTDEDELFWSICHEEPNYPLFLSNEALHILTHLLVKTPSKRLGMPSCSAGDIKDHAFFKNIDWNKIENKEVPPPFKPKVSGPCDTSNFDTSFTKFPPVLSPVDSKLLKSMDQEQFNGFSYTNPHLTG